MTGARGVVVGARASVPRASGLRQQPPDHTDERHGVTRRLLEGGGLEVLERHAVGRAEVPCREGGVGILARAQ